VRLQPYGEAALLVDLDPDDPSPAAAAAAARAALPAAQDVVPGDRTLLVTWPAGAPPDAAALRTALAGAQVPGTGARCQAPVPEVVLDVRYDGPDLHDVAARVGLSPEAVVARHAAAAYEVAFVGFLPGFAYLVGGDPVLHVPRRADPRPRVPAGSVAVAGPYSAVYPRASPGGWQLLGTCEAVLFDPDRDPPALLPAGTPVRFRARP
jgi:allophanate hydrolase subunit 1